MILGSVFAFSEAKIRAAFKILGKTSFIFSIWVQELILPLGNGLHSDKIKLFGLFYKLGSIE